MPAPKVFISATSADLASTREVVKEALLTIGCHPIEQTNFPPDWRDVKDMLYERGQIGDCQALIHIVGLHYGAEPDPTTFPKGTPRRSYTQMEYDLGRKLQRKRGDNRFRVYTFVCPEDYPYDTAPAPESDEKRELQQKHRGAILKGAALYETPANKVALEKRVLALREEVLTLRAAENRRAQLTLAGIALIVLALAGIGYALIDLTSETAQQTAEEVAKQLDPELVATRLRQEIESRFQSEAEVARAAGKNWEAIRELERRRDDALARVDDIVRTIKEGLAGNPSPIFTEASRILTEEGVDAAIAYLDSHKTDQLARAERAAAQVGVAKEKLQRELQPLLLQAELHETRLEWDKAVALLAQVAETAPNWFEARLRLGSLLDTLARYAEAEPHKRAAVTLARNPEEEATALNNLAQLLQNTNRLDEAEPLMRQVIEIFERSYGLNHPDVATALNNLALLLQATNRLDEAEPLMRRALEIDEASYGPDHPKVAIRLNNLAELLRETNRLDEAEPLVRLALVIDEASYGPDHPSVATTLNNLAELLRETNRLDEAEPLYHRAIAIHEASYGPEHPSVAIDLNNLALLLYATNSLAEAEPLMRRHVEIFILVTKRTGHEHPHLHAAFANYVALLSKMGFDEAEQEKKIQSLRDSVQNLPND